MKNLIEWANSQGIPKTKIEQLIPFLPQPYEISDEYTSWIESEVWIIKNSSKESLNHLSENPIDLGFLIIGSCPNGDPVLVNLAYDNLPVYYLSHEEMYENKIKDIVLKVAESIDEYSQNIYDENSDIALDYWDLKDQS